MTIRECSRLQSMEDLKHLPKGAFAAEAFGNAVNVIVAKAVLSALLRVRNDEKISCSSDPQVFSAGPEQQLGLQ